MAKTSPKHGQMIEPTHESGALLPEEEEPWGRFPSIPTTEQIFGLRAETDSLNALSDLESVRKSHCARDSLEYGKLKQLTALG